VFYWCVVRLYDSDPPHHAKWIELTIRSFTNASYFWRTLTIEALSSSSVEFKSSVSLENQSVPDTHVLVHPHLLFSYLPDRP